MDADFLRNLQGQDATPTDGKISICHECITNCPRRKWQDNCLCYSLRVDCCISRIYLQHYQMYEKAKG